MSLTKLVIISLVYLKAFAFPANFDNDNHTLGIIDLSHFGEALLGEPDESVGDLVDKWTPESGVNPDELGSYVEGDILIPKSNSRNGIIGEAYRWPENTIPYQFHNSVPKSVRRTIMSAINTYHSKTCLIFTPRTFETDYVLFTSERTGCWSAVGRIYGEQVLNIQTNGCNYKGIVIHELMHAIGFFHEHSRTDRDEYVTIMYQNIISGKERNFEIEPDTTSFRVGYDKGSIMHYSSIAFSKNGRRTIVANPLPSSDPQSKVRMGQRKGFAISDLLKIRLMYNCDYLK